MTKILRKSQERGHLNFGWLDTYHSFSFGEYYDPKHMGFRDLRVINEDRIAAGRGFGTHPHNDMEIVTYVLSGALTHKDSMGNGSVIHAGDVQKMSAGTGVKHSEANDSEAEEAYLLQIWILPDERNLTPSYDQKFFEEVQKQNKLCLIASPDAAQGSVSIHQDVKIYASLLDKGKNLSHPLNAGRAAWVQLISGDLQVNGEVLQSGDALALEEEKTVEISAKTNAHFLLFDLN